MKAHDRELKDWYTKIEQGEIKLPRFQRHEAWDKWRIASLLETVVNNLPLGVTLLLEVGDKEKFESRYIETAKPKSYSKVTEHLLDGQQRLTAIWRTLHNNYDQETYFMGLAEFSNHPDWTREDEESNTIPVVYQTRWYRKEKKYPLWCNDPKEVLHRGLIPTDLLFPHADTSILKNWLEVALSNFKPSQDEENYAQKLESYYNKRDTIFDKVSSVKESVKHYNLPFLSLPSQTEKNTALQVFINMNTNTKPLSIYDIIVAEIEMEKGKSLHELQDALDEKYPNIKNYYSLSYLMLYTSALLQEKIPSQRGIESMDKSSVIENRENVEIGLNRMVYFLERQKIFDKERLPTNAVLAVIAALYAYIPNNGDKLGKDEILLTKYLRSSFFTDRYENAAASRAYADFISMKHILLNNLKEDDSLYTEEDVPVLNRKEFPLATFDELKTVGRPKRESIRGRGILAVAHMLGAHDFADGQPLTKEHIQKREYHHIFPYAMLEKVGINGDIALNCALITGKTNRNISDKDPMKYILERYNWVSQNIVHQRLLSHLIPVEELENGGYEGLTESQKIEKIKSDFERFIDKRAMYIIKAAQQLCDGKSISIHSILENSKKEKITVDDVIIMLQSKTKENYEVELKSSLRRCTKTNQVNKDLELVIAKTVNAFLNGYGGILIIGVTDNGDIYGLENDFKSLGDKGRDGFDLHIMQIITNYIGVEWSNLIQLDYHDIDGKDVCVMQIKESHKPVYLKKEIKESFFYIRIGAKSEPLKGEAVQKYIENRWR